MRILADRYKALFVRFTAAVLLVLLCAQSVYAARTTKIFVVKSRTIPSYDQAIEGFTQLASKDWTTVEYDLQGTLKNTDKMIKQLERENPNLVVAVGAKALAALTRSGVKKPTVFCAVINITKYDTRKLNITGITLTTSPQKQLETLSKLSPNIKTIGVFLRKKQSQDLLKTAEEAAAKYNIKIIPMEFESEIQIPRKLRKVLNDVDALWMLDDAYIHSKESLEFVILNSLENDLPFMAISEAFVEEGALLSLSPSFSDNGKQTAKLARRILEQNIRPKDIPISFHKNPDLVINLKIAKKIGIKIPLEFLDEAKKVLK